MNINYNFSVHFNTGRKNKLTTVCAIASHSWKVYNNGGLKNFIRTLM